MSFNAVILQLISNALILLGVVVAIVTIIYNIRIAKKTQTANFLFESRQDKHYIESLHVLNKVHRSGKSFRSYVFPCEGRSITEEEMTERRKLQYILNFYERVAVSIREGIYNEKMIKRASFSTIMETYGIAEPLINAIREYNKSETTYRSLSGWLGAGEPNRCGQTVK